MSTLKTKLNKSLAAGFFEVTHGIDFDHLLFKEEIQVQKAWLDELKKLKIVSAQEHRKIKQGLTRAEKLMGSGKFSWRLEDEDIHMNLENFLTTSCGDCAKKIHTGRSRNDLIATTLRLYMRNQSQAIRADLQSLVKLFATRAEAFSTKLVPGFTHNQSAQPMRVGQLFVSHGFAFSRDRERFERVGDRSMAYLPLGSGALTGTHLNVNLPALAKALGFQSPSYCSHDAVGDRDFLIEFAQAAALLASHLARFANDVIFLSSTPIGVIRLPEQWASGSSMMPNKKNPDLFEILRAKAARIIAASNEATMIVHALPSGYASDLHELKRVTHRIIVETNLCLKALIAAVPGLGIDDKKCAQILKQGHILATDIANSYASKGMSFRDAYKKVADLVTQAEKSGKQVHEVESEITFEDAVESRSNVGGNSLRRLKESIGILRKSAS